MMKRKVYESERRMKAIAGGRADRREGREAVVVEVW